MCACDCMRGRVRHIFVVIVFTFIKISTFEQCEDNHQKIIILLL